MYITQVTELTLLSECNVAHVLYHMYVSFTTPYSCNISDSLKPISLLLYDLQILKKNLSAEAVRSIAVILGSTSASSPENKTSQSTTSLNDNAQTTPNRHPKIKQSNSGSKLLKQLLQDTTSRLVSHVEEVHFDYCKFIICNG